MDARAVTSSSASTVADDARSPAMTQAGMILGTAAYMAPEQARGQDRRQTRRHLGVWRRRLRDADRTSSVRGHDISITLASVMMEPSGRPARGDTASSAPAVCKRHPKRGLRGHRRRDASIAGPAEVRTIPRRDAYRSTSAAAGRRGDARTGRRVIDADVIDPIWLFLSLIPGGDRVRAVRVRQEAPRALGASSPPASCFMVYPYFTPSVAALSAVGVALGCR